MHEMIYDRKYDNVWIIKCPSALRLLKDPFPFDLRHHPVKTHPIDTPLQSLHPGYRQPHPRPFASD